MAGDANAGFDPKRLTDVERAVLDHVSRGETYRGHASFRLSQTGADGPVHTVAMIGGVERPLGDAECVRAAFVRHLLLGLHDSWPAPFQGLRIEGVRITGKLDLDYARSADGGALPALLLTHCCFDESVSICVVEIGGLDFSYSLLPALNAEFLKVSGPLGLYETVLTSTDAAKINISFAEITGLTSAYGLSAHPDATRVEVWMMQCTFRGTCAVSGTGRVEGAAPGLIKLSIWCSTFNGELDLSRAHFSSIDAANIMVSGNLLLGDTTISEHAGFAAAEINGEVRADKLRLLPGSRGLTLTGARLRQTLLMRNCTLHGGITMMGFRCESGWELVGTQITPGVTDEARGWAIAAREAQFGGSVLMRGIPGQPFQCEGLIGMHGATISGNLDLRGAQCRAAPGGTISGPEALTASLMLRSAQISGDLLIGAWSDGSESSFTGVVDLENAQIGRNLDMTGATFTPGEGNDTILCLRDAHVTGQLRARGLGQQSETTGIINLAGLSCGALDDRGNRGWGEQPSHRGRDDKGVRLILNGFSYGRLAEDDGEQGTLWSERRQWLRRQPRGSGGESTYFPQPYDYLCQFLIANGRDHDARKVLIAKQVARRKYGATSLLGKLFSILYQITFGYGCSPLRTTATLIAYWGIGIAWLSVAQTRGKVGPIGDKDTACLDFSPGLRALELMVPLPNITGSDCGIRAAAIGWKAAEVGYALVGAVILALAILTLSGITRNALTK